MTASEKEMLEKIRRGSRDISDGAAVHFLLLLVDKQESLIEACEKIADDMFCEGAGIGDCAICNLKDLLRTRGTSGQ